MFEKIIRAIDLNCIGTILFKSHQLLAYTDDIDIVGRNKGRNRILKQLGLVVNENKPNEPTAFK